MVIFYSWWRLLGTQFMRQKISVIKLFKWYWVTYMRSTEKCVKPCVAVETKGIIRQSLKQHYMYIKIIILIWIRSVHFEATLLIICTRWAWVHILEQPWSIWTELLLHAIRLQNALVRVQPTSGTLEVWKSKPCFASTAKGIINLLEILDSICR